MYLSLYNNSPVYGYIYKIIFPNGKCYIGLTVDLDARWKQHKWSAKSGNYNYLLYRALIKYEMVDTFIMWIIDTAETAEELCEKEIAHIEIHNSHYKSGNGYNMTYGGEGFNGYIRTEEDNRKTSEKMKQYYIDNPEEREKRSKIMKQYYKDNPEIIQKMSDSQLERFKNPEEIEKTRKAAVKRFDSQEEREKHSIRMKKRFVDNPELKEKINKAQKQRFIDNPEEREKQSKRMKQYYKDNPEARKEYGEKMKQYYKNNPSCKYKILDCKGQNKPFDVFKIDGTYIKSFNYQCEAMKYLQTTYDIKTRIKICSVLQGKRKSSHGFTFKYKE
jgi:predicted GIY-YIG superfamily endonuclease